MISWLVSCLSLLGVVLNIHKRVAAFWIWTGTNAYWAVTDFHAELYAQGMLMLIYFGLSIYGICRWSARPGGTSHGE